MRLRVGRFRRASGITRNARGRVLSGRRRVAGSVARKRPLRGPCLLIERRRNGDLRQYGSAGVYDRRYGNAGLEVRRQKIRSFAADPRVENGTHQLMKIVIFGDSLALPREDVGGDELLEVTYPFLLDQALRRQFGAAA